MKLPCLSFVFTFLLLTLSHALLPSMAVWPYQSRSFNVRPRWEYCLKSHVDIRANASSGDYGAIISKEMAKLSENGGGSVRLLDGTYIVNSPIQFKNNTCLLGQSLNGVIIKVADDAPLSEDIRGVLHGVNVENITARDFTLDVNKKGQDDDKCKNEFTKYGTYFEASSYLWFINTRVMNACSYGYDFPGNNETFSSNVVLENSYADSNGKDGIKIFRMLNTSIINTLTLNNGRHGAYIAGSENILLDSNTFTADGAKDSYKGCGVMITDRQELWSDGIIARYNRIHNFYRAGFCLGGTRWVGLIDSYITNFRRKKALCYEMDGAEDVTIVRGTCNTEGNEEVETNDTSPSFSGTSVDPPSVTETSEPVTEDADTNGSVQPSFSTGNVVANDPNKVPEMTKETPTKCLSGELEKGGVCCPGICGKCGGKGCSDRAPYKACCIKAIRKAGNSCANGPAPCNL